MLFALLVAVSCQEELSCPSEVEAPEGYVNLSFSATVPDMDLVSTRAVDPDGGGIQHIILYCFDSYGLFITTVSLSGDEHTPDGNTPSLAGTFKATVPDHTDIVHIVGNQVITDFSEDEFRNKSEFEVMSALEASAGRMIYWARRTVTQLKEHQESGDPVELIRNQAKVTVEVEKDPQGNPVTDFEVVGFVVTNTNAFGTVAPYHHPTDRFLIPSVDNPFVTLAENDSKLGDFLDVRGNREEYVFETRNDIDDPVNVIIKGGPDNLYYRILLLDGDGSQIMILRNHHYKVMISDELSYGEASFEDALKAPATNNVWVSVEDHVKEVHGLDYILSVDETAVVLDESEFLSPNLKTVYYTLKKVDGSALTADDKPDVSWMTGNEVAYNSFLHNFDPSTGRGTITLTLHGMGSQGIREGTLMIRKGRLYRKVTVTTLKKQVFTPAWAATQVYGHAVGEHLTLMFTIPEDCPEGLFPLEVLISTNILDVRHESGQEFPIRLKQDAGDKFYGEDNEWGYKYVMTVDSPGKKRLYLENILVQEDGGASTIRLEAEHFEPLTKNFTFADDPVNRIIMFPDLKKFSAVEPADEYIYYYLVPQKINADVMLKVVLGQVNYDGAGNPVDTTVITPGAADEFLFYSRYLDHDESRKFDFDFYPINESSWGTGGRVYGFVRRIPGVTPVGDGAIFHMKTNSSRSAEVVRIASNVDGQPSVLPPHSASCTGLQYRSKVFDIANYRPFRFAAQINYDNRGAVGTILDGQVDEVEDDMSWTYVPGKPVDLSLEITSFMGSDGRSVDPFGTSFEVYVDAPMLEIDWDRVPQKWLTDGKFKEDPARAGRFIYVVDSDREKEREYGTLTPVLADASGADQTRERRLLPFKVKDIVSAGDITVSSQEEVVVFYRKSFHITNESIRGMLSYDDGGTPRALPADAFVVLERIKTYNRIGTITVSDVRSDGTNYEIRLRGEYSYSWNTDDPVKIQYVRTLGGNTYVYEKIFANLSSLYDAKDITLELKIE